ncbi:ATP-binding protein [bacterium]|nr:ATP-binding protein [bacterium]
MNLIAQGEGENLDFKHSISNTYKIARAITAFANHTGGTLLIGIKDNGKAAKINCEEEIYMLEAALEKCKPSIDYQIDEVAVDGKNILCMQVQGGNNLPYLCLTEEGKWMAFVRVKDSNVLANWVWLQVAKQKSRHVNFHLAYKETEEQVLKFLNENQSVTQKEIARQLKINFRRLGQILVTLVGMGLVEMQLSKEGAYYSAAG